MAGSNNQQFDVTFPNQTAAGTYTLVIGPGINNSLGRPMDQNGNGVNGEDPGDRYTTTFGLPLPVPLPFQEDFDNGTAPTSSAVGHLVGQHRPLPRQPVTLRRRRQHAAGQRQPARQPGIRRDDERYPASGSFYSNGFVIFDYQAPTNFKFAGAFVGIQQWVIGHRDVTGWHTTPR